MIQAHVFYSGRVQGVGFRYTVVQYAVDKGLFGWVRNLPDSRVEILVEGRKEDIEQLLQSIDQYFEGYIREKKIDYGSAQGQFKNFSIKF